MERVWCYRCKAWVQGLDESEYREIHDLWIANTMSVKEARSHGQTLGEAMSQYAPVIAAHQKLTGESGVPVREIYRHRLANFGPPCPVCGKNLLTPKAKQCFGCGWDGRVRSAT